VGVRLSIIIGMVSDMFVFSRRLWVQVQADCPWSIGNRNSQRL